MESGSCSINFLKLLHALDVTVGAVAFSRATLEEFKRKYPPPGSLLGRRSFRRVGFGFHYVRQCISSLFLDALPPLLNQQSAGSPLFSSAKQHPRDNRARSIGHWTFSNLKTLRDASRLDNL